MESKTEFVLYLFPNPQKPLEFVCQFQSMETWSLEDLDDAVVGVFIVIALHSRLLRLFNPAHPQIYAVSQTPFDSRFVRKLLICLHRIPDFPLQSTNFAYEYLDDFFAVN